MSIHPTALKKALADLAAVAQEIDESGVGVEHLTLCVMDGRPHSPMLMVTPYVFDQLVESERAEPDSRVKDLDTYQRPNGTWTAVCVYSGVRIIAGDYASRPEWGGKPIAEVSS